MSGCKTNDTAYSPHPCGQTLNNGSSLPTLRNLYCPATVTFYRRKAITLMAVIKSDTSASFTSGNTKLFYSSIGKTPTFNVSIVFPKQLALFPTKHVNICFLQLKQSCCFGYRDSTNSSIYSCSNVS